MKKCIWCSKTEDETTFDKLAHTIPKSLGGIRICDNVCDSCNAYFGSHYQGLPPIETVIKETFNISRARLLSSIDKIGRNKPLSRFKSIYFKVDFKNQKISINPSYKFHRFFQEKICRQLKRGLYKMYLEEVERQKGDGHNSKYDFIREFARYNIGDYPVLYFERLNGVILVIDEWIKHPELLIDEQTQFKYLVREPSFCEFEFLGHVFLIATSRHWEIAFDNYIKKSREAKKQFFKSWKLVEKFNDIDLLLSIMND